jgi:hypothetical protein
MRKGPLTWENGAYQSGHVPDQEGTFSMGSSHTLDQLDICFDDTHTVANAGLLLAATLAERLGLEQAADALIDLDGGQIMVRKQLNQVGWKAQLSDVKTDSSDAPVALDTQTIQVLRAHRARQLHQCLAMGPAWVDTGLVFTQPNGYQLQPASVTPTTSRPTRP